MRGTKQKPTATNGDDEAGKAIFSKDDEEVMQQIMVKVIAEGFVPVNRLHEEFGDTKTTKALAILHKTWRVLVEAREPWDGQEVKGFKKAERRFSQPEIRKLPQALAFLPALFTGAQNKYGEYQSLAVRCRYLTEVLGAVPRKTDNGETLLCFERNWTGKDFIIQRYGIRKMFSRALELSNRQWHAAHRMGFDTIVIRDPKYRTDHIRGVIGDDGKGLGTARSECLAAGTEFILRATIPTTYLSPAEFLQVLKIGGQQVGLSPGRSAGYGDFEILGVEPS